MKLLPMPADIYRTLLDALKTDEEEYGRSAENVNARIWLKALRDYWPTMPDLEGRDMFPDAPISGEQTHGDD